MRPLLARLGQRWPDALRMVASGLIAFALSSFVLRLPESMWAVLTALIVSRPDMQGAVGAGIGRLAGTIFGAAIAVRCRSATSTMCRRSCFWLQCWCQLRYWRPRAANIAQPRSRR